MNQEIKELLLARHHKEKRYDPEYLIDLLLGDHSLENENRELMLELAGVEEEERKLLRKLDKIKLLFDDPGLDSDCLRDEILGVIDFYE